MKSMNRPCKVTARCRIYLAGVLLVSCLSSCDIINPAEPVPAYIHMDSIGLVTDLVTEGTRLSNFSDAWISVNGNYLGTFELPFTVPVIGEGPHKISVRAGVQENGISGVRKAYMKTSTFDTTIHLQANQTNQITAQVRYLNGTIFSQLEDFDDGSLSLTGTSANSATLSITPSSDPAALEGNSAYVLLDSNHPVFEYASSAPFTLPISVPVYVELNYKCSGEITVGLFITNSSGILQNPLVNIRPSTEWKKIYINLSEAGGIFASAINYKLYLKSVLPAGQSSAEIYLDNLKVLY